MPRVTPPKKPMAVDDISIYSKEDLEKIYNRLQSTNLLTAFQLGIHLGVRARECYGLRWSDFDFDNNTVKINKQLQYQNKMWCLTTTKTVNSDRTITFDDKLKQYLLDLRDKQQLCCTNRKDNKILDVRDKKNPQLLIIEDFVNIKENGEMLNTYSHKVVARIAAGELGIDFKFHNLRHTHATVLLEKGINPKYIQERLGHSKLEFTLRLYTHVTRKMETDSADALGAYLDF